MNKDTKGNHLEPSGVSLSQDGQSVKIGDLVTYSSNGISDNFVGLVTESGAWTGNCDVKVLWNTEEESVTQKSCYLKVIK
tara:strand:+ start:115 stop:354 length:240 start_codon:yes stop_codon:yes gene_type:complete